MAYGFKGGSGLGAEPWSQTPNAFHFYTKTSGTCYSQTAKHIYGIDERVNIESISIHLEPMRSLYADGATGKINMGHLLNRTVDRKYPSAAGGDGVYIFDTDGKRYVDGSPPLLIDGAWRNTAYKSG